MENGSEYIKRYYIKYSSSMRLKHINSPAIAALLPLQKSTAPLKSQGLQPFPAQPL